MNIGEGSGNSIPTAPKPPKSHASPAKHTTTHHTTSHSSGSSGGGGGGSSAPRRPRSTAGRPSGGGGGGGGGGISAAQRRAERIADAKEAKADRETSQRYLGQVASLSQQARALRAALAPTGIRKALNTRLANVTLVVGQQDKELVKSWRERVGALRDTARDNEKAAEQQSYAALATRGRERANAMSEAMANGAGESDMLRTQQMSLRAWNTNQNEVQRTYHDTLTSINSSLTDLNADTRTSRINMAAQGNKDREQLWTDYYQQRSETSTQLGNVYGQQAEFYGLANEAVANKGVRKHQKQRQQLSGAAFMAATRASSSAWKNPGVSANLRNWAGAADIKDTRQPTKQREAVTETPLKRPEGATLRDWT